MLNGQRSQEIFRLAKEGKVAEAYELQHEANDVIATKKIFLKIPETFLVNG